MQTVWYGNNIVMWKTTPKIKKNQQNKPYKNAGTIVQHTSLSVAWHSENEHDVGYTYHLKEYAETLTDWCQMRLAEKGRQLSMGKFQGSDES